MRDTLPRFGVDVALVDTSDLAAVAGAVSEDRTDMVWIETPANPILRNYLSDCND